MNRKALLAIVRQSPPLALSLAACGSDSAKTGRQRDQRPAAPRPSPAS